MKVYGVEIAINTQYFSTANKINLKKKQETESYLLIGYDVFSRELVSLLLQLPAVVAVFLPALPNRIQVGMYTIFRNTIQLGTTCYQKM